jgi:hypothetical protein
MKDLVLIVVAIVSLVFAHSTEAQQPTKVHRIGYLTGVSLSAMAARNESFRQGLRELGYVEEKTLSLSGGLGRENKTASAYSRLN